MMVLGTVRLGILCAAVSLVLARHSAAAAPPANVPIQGTGKARADFDQAMLAHLERSKATAATLAVMVEGQVVYSRGYGWLDEARTRPAPADTPMRVASISKPITSATVRSLARDGKLKLSDPVLPLMGIEPPGGDVVDPRWRQITIDQLLHHRGGWDLKQLGFDPMFSPGRARKALKLDHPPTPADMVRWMMTLPLSFDPGERSNYSNFGYCVLGRVIAHVDGRPYLAAVRQRVFEAVGIDPHQVWLAHVDSAKRDPREPWYNEKLDVDIMDAHGGIVISSPVLCQWLNAYWISGQPRPSGARGQVWTFFGSMPGTSAIAHQRKDGVNFACAFNGRHSDAPQEELTKKMNELIDAVGSRAAEE